MHVQSPLVAPVHQTKLLDSDFLAGYPNQAWLTFHLQLSLFPLDFSFANSTHKRYSRQLSNAEKAHFLESNNRCFAAIQSNPCLEHLDH